MLETILLATTLPVALALTFYYLRKAGKKQIAPDGNGTIILVSPKIWSVIGVATWILCILMLSLFEIRREDIIPAIVLSLLLGWAGTYCILRARNFKVRFNDVKTEVVNTYGKIRSIHWAQVQQGDFNAVTHMIKLTGHHGETLKVPHQMVGIELFLDALEARTGLSRERIGIPVLHD